MADRSDILAPPPVVAMLGWLIPGAGYWLLGQRLRAIVIGVTILVLNGALAYVVNSREPALSYVILSVSVAVQLLLAGAAGAQAA